MIETTFALSLALGAMNAPLATMAQLKTQSQVPSAALVPGGAANQEAGPGDKDEARFDFLKKRMLEKKGLPPEAGETSDQSKWGPAPAPWKELEKARAARFDRRFGQGTYEAVIRFSGACLYANGCQRLLTADLISGAYRFIDLEKDVESGVVVRGSQAYRSRDAEIVAEMRAAIENFRPKAGAAKEYTESFTAFADPILNNL